MEKLRISLLTVIFGGVFCTLLRTVLTPTTSETALTTFVFPPAVPLAEWQLKTSRSLTPIAKNNYLSGRHYQYIQQEQTLDIEMRYLTHTQGDIQSFIQHYSSVPLSSERLTPVLRKQPGVGFYHLFTYQQRAYLSSCINVRGGSTVTVSQFRQNRYTYDLFALRLKERVIPWLQGQVSILDTRCLWAQMSLPVENSSDVAYQTLEKAWLTWYQWWHPRFPQP